MHFVFADASARKKTKVLFHEVCGPELRPTKFGRQVAVRLKLARPGTGYRTVMAPSGRSAAAGADAAGARAGASAGTRSIVDVAASVPAGTDEVLVASAKALAAVPLSDLGAAAPAVAVPVAVPAAAGGLKSAASLGKEAGSGPAAGVQGVAGAASLSQASTAPVAAPGGGAVPGVPPVQGGAAASSGAAASAPAVAGSGSEAAAAGDEAAACGFGGPPDDEGGGCVEDDALLQFPVDATHEVNLARAVDLVGQDMLSLVDSLWPVDEGGLGSGLGACVLWVLYALSTALGGGGLRVLSLETMTYAFKPFGDTRERPVVFSALSTLHPWYAAAAEQAFAQLMAIVEAQGDMAPAPAVSTCFVVFKSLLSKVGPKSSTVGLEAAPGPRAVDSGRPAETCGGEALPLANAINALGGAIGSLVGGGGVAGSGTASSDKLSTGVMASSLQKFTAKVGLELTLTEVASPTPSKAILAGLLNPTGPTLSMVPSVQPYNLVPWHVGKGVLSKERFGKTTYGPMGMTQEDDYATDFDPDCGLEQLVEGCELFFRTVHVLAMNLPDPSTWITLGPWNRVISLLRSSKVNGASALTLFRPLFITAVEVVNSTVGTDAAITFDGAFKACADSLEQVLLVLQSSVAAFGALGRAGGSALVSAAPTPIKGDAAQAAQAENERLKRKLENQGRHVDNLKRQHRGGGRGGGGGGFGGRGGGGRGGGARGGGGGGRGGLRQVGGFARALRPDEEGKKKGGLDQSQFGDCLRPDCGNDTWCNRSHAKKGDYVRESQR